MVDHRRRGDNRGRLGGGAAVEGGAEQRPVFSRGSREHYSRPVRAAAGTGLQPEPEGRQREPFGVRNPIPGQAVGQAVGQAAGQAVGQAVG